MPWGEHRLLSSSLDSNVRASDLPYVQLHAPHEITTVYTNLEQTATVICGVYVGHV